VAKGEGGEARVAEDEAIVDHEEVVVDVGDVVELETTTTKRTMIRRRPAKTEIAATRTKLNRNRNLTTPKLTANLIIIILTIMEARRPKMIPNLTPKEEEEEVEVMVRNEIVAASIKPRIIIIKRGTKNSNSHQQLHG
jgi:acyl-CoA hydrolase